MTRLDGAFSKPEPEKCLVIAQIQSLLGTSVDTKRIQDVPKLVVFAITTIPPRMYFLP
jgi:hypothetical protein